MVRDERIKLLSNLVNAIGLGMIAIAVLRPILETGGDPFRIVLWSLTGLALHAVAHYILG